MKVYLSQGDWRWPDTRRIVAAQRYPNVLISFAYDADGEFFEKRLGYWPDAILGDSGAFTVWTQGGTVDLDAYTAWALRYQETRPDFLAITLDVIPGSPEGGEPTQAQRDRAIRQGIENSDALRHAGVRIMEVYHLHEPREHLDLLLERRRPGEVVGIGGLAGGGSKTVKLRFLDRTFRYIGEAYGWSACPPLHGLGLSPTSPLCFYYPWVSVDSSSWVSPGRFGREITRTGRRGKKDDRVGHMGVRGIYLDRVLADWRRQEDVLSRKWGERVTHLA